MRASASLRVLFAVALVWVAVAVIEGQQKPTFRSGVEVVLFDVNVVDGSHVPVSDLTAADFVVSVDRQDRKVVSAEFVRYDVRPSTTSARRPAPVSAGATGAAKTSARPPARNLLIAIDTDSMEPGDGMLAVRESSKFIDALAPDDRVGVVTIPRMQSAVTMTKERKEAKAELAKVVTGSERYRSPQFNIGLAEAFDIEGGDTELMARVIRRECTPGYQGCPQEVQMEIRQIHLQAHLRAQRSLDALGGLGKSVMGIEGAKTLVFITGGAPVPDLKVMTAYSEMGKAFAAAQISLYTLYIHQEQLHQVRYRPSPTATQDMTLEKFGAENTTGAANGTMMNVVGAYDLYFDRILTELSGAYVIGIEVQSSDRDGKPHYVSVNVKRKGADVRARQQYVIEAADKRAPTPVAPANAASSLPATPGELQPFVERMQQYVRGYEKAFLALLCEERSDLHLAKWTVRDGKGSWAPTAQRRVAAENLLVKRGGVGWGVARDVFEVNGKALRTRDGRLRAMYLESPDDILDRSASLASDGYSIGFVDRSSNVSVSPLALLLFGDDGHFVFAKQAEQTVAGVPTWQIVFAEHGEPAIIRGATESAPITGAMWVDPKNGTIIKTVVTWRINGTTSELTVTYGNATDGSGLWVPVEMLETYTSASDRLECTTKFTSYRRFE